MHTETPHLEQQAKESIKEFLTKELNKPELAKKTAEDIEKDSEGIKILKNMLEKNIKPIIEKGEKLDINNPEDIKKAKILIAYNMLQWGDIDGYFPKKIDEQINRASAILETEIDEANFDKRQGQSININTDSPDQQNQVISYKAEFTSGNQKFDQLLKTYPSLKKYLDLQVMHKNLSRLNAMIREKGAGSDGGKFKQLKQELWAKKDTLWREESNLSKELFSDPTKAMDIVKILSNFTPNELNTEGFYEIKDILKELLRGSGDTTFSYRDLDYNNGVDSDYSSGKIKITKPHVDIDNMQIISTGSDGIKFKNIITGQETTFNKNVILKAKEIREQNNADWEYMKTKRETIRKKLNINTEDDLSRENEIKVNETLIKEAFGIDQKLFEVVRRMRHYNGEEGANSISSETGAVLNKILKEKGVNNIDCTRGRTTIKGKEINGKKVFILDQGDTKIIIPFSGQAKVEHHQMTQQEMNEPIKDFEKSGSYMRAEYEIEHPRKIDEIDLAGLGLNSKEVTSLLSHPKLTQIDNLKVNLIDNNISIFPDILIIVN